MGPGLEAVFAGQCCTAQAVSFRLKFTPAAAEHLFDSGLGQLELDTSSGRDPASERKDRGHWWDDRERAERAAG
jgi:hypothetical protein